MSGIIILIPPSEGKNEGGNNPEIKNINLITKQLIDEINNYPNPEKLLGLKEKALNKAIKINKNILNSPTLKAIERYKGVVYSGIDFPTIKNKELFNERIRIVSALFGIISPEKLIPDYKLKIDKLNSAKLWKEYNSLLLKNKFVIDLLPQAHKKAVSYDEGTQVEFVIIKNGKKIPAGHNGKLIKGRFIRWLIENDVKEVSAFKNFTEDGFFWEDGVFVKIV